MTIYRLKIGDREVPVNLIEVPAEGGQAPAINSSYNQPFQDEICIKLETGPQSAPKFYVVQLHSSEKPQEIKDQLLAALPEGEKSVEWIHDEDPEETYRISALEINFGWRTETGEVVMAGQDDLDFDIGEAREEIRKYLGGIREGMRIDAGQNEILINYLDRLKEIFPDKVVDTLAGIVWADDGSKSIEIRFLLTPPTKVLHPIINIEGGGELPEWEQEKIASFFGIDLKDIPVIDKVLKKITSFIYEKPLTRAALAEGLIKLNEYFRTHDKYYLAEKNPLRMFGYTKERELNLHLSLRPHPKAFDFHVVELDDTGAVVRRAHLSPGSKLPARIKQPLNEENIQENLDALLDAYGRQGFLANAVSVASLVGDDLDSLDPAIPASISEGNLVYQIILKPNPIRSVVIEGSPAPDAEDVQKMFSPNGHYSTTSILEGLRKLHQWYGKKGYHLKPGEPKYKIEGDKLVVVAQPAGFEEIEVYYHYKDKEGVTQRLKLDEVPDDVLSPTARHNIENELQHIKKQTSEDGLYHHDTLLRGVWRLRSNYSHYVSYPQTVAIDHNVETNRVSVTIHIHDDSIKGSGVTVAGGGRFGGSQIGSEKWAVSGSANARARTRSGYNPGARLGYLKAGPDHIGEAGASLQIPWITDRGLSAEVGTNNTIVLHHEDGTPYDHIIGVYGEIDQPLRHSNDEWGYIAGVAAHGIIDPDDGYQKTWFKSNIAGIRYYTPKTSARVTTGPRVSTEREIYWEMMFNTEHRVDLVVSGRFYLRLKESSGARFGIGGEVPYDQLFRGFAFSTGYEGISEEEGTHFAGARADVMYDIIPSFLSVGAGLSARVIKSPRNGFISEGGAGFNVRLARAVELLFGPRIREIDDKTSFDPFALTITADVEF